uniref:ARID domain-containing protein n=1 Tax=Macrostomum lignano TaxID=282301 RepID=A0A1I8ISL3_9PLAT
MNRKKQTCHQQQTARPRLLSEQDRAQFDLQLREFHSARKTPFLHAPIVFGRRVDFHRLYNAVARLGGFRRV